jgi:cysteine synthase
VITVSAADAATYCRALRNLCGIWVGGSSGAAVAAAARWLRGRKEMRAVVICPDHGWLYEDTLDNPWWLERHDLIRPYDRLVHRR